MCSQAENIESGRSNHFSIILENNDENVNGHKFCDMKPEQIAECFSKIRYSKYTSDIISHFIINSDLFRV